MTYDAELANVHPTNLFLIPKINFLESDSVIDVTNRAFSFLIYSRTKTGRFSANNFSFLKIINR
jgi:hypothetical protein